jgi:hypothetical protein
MLLCGVVLPFLAGCASREYLFGVAGQVLDGRGKPVAGARVTLTTARPVYDAGTPVGSPAIETDGVGWFAFTYTTHHLPTRYVILVEKPGCPPEEVESVAPPSQEHSIKLSCQMPLKAR